MASSSIRLLAATDELDAAALPLSLAGLTSLGLAGVLTSANSFAAAAAATARFYEHNEYHETERTVA